MARSTAFAVRLSQQRAGGFTLVEVLVTISVMAIMLGLAAPSFVSFQRNSELTSTANSFVGALATARSEALKRQLNVFVVPQDGSNWANGLTIFVDVNRDSALRPSGTDIVLMNTDKIPSSVTTSAYTGGAYIEFNGSGFMTTVANSIALAGSLDFTSTSTEVRRVIASPAGRLRVCKPPPSDASCTRTDL